MSDDFQLKIYPDTVLRKKAGPVENLDAYIYRIIESMSNIMYENKGIGLAAPQVGISKRIIMADIGEGLQVLINPVIRYQEGENRGEEGCLSVPDSQMHITRKTSILVSATNPAGHSIELEAHQLMARVIQHEIDHLDGVLIVDYGVHQ